MTIYKDVGALEGKSDISGEHILYLIDGLLISLELTEGPADWTWNMMQEFINKYEPEGHGKDDK